MCVCVCGRMAQILTAARRLVILHAPANESWSHTKNHVNLTYFTGQSTPAKSGREYAFSSKLSFIAHGVLVYWWFNHEMTPDRTKISVLSKLLANDTLVHSMLETYLLHKPTSSDTTQTAPESFGFFSRFSHHQFRFRFSLTFRHTRQYTKPACRSFVSSH